MKGRLEKVSRQRLQNFDNLQQVVFSSAEKLRSRGFTYYAFFLAQSLRSVKLLMIVFS